MLNWVVRITEINVGSIVLLLLHPFHSWGKNVSAFIGLIRNFKPLKTWTDQGLSSSKSEKHWYQVTCIDHMTISSLISSEHFARLFPPVSLVPKRRQWDVAQQFPQASVGKSQFSPPTGAILSYCQRNHKNGCASASIMAQKDLSGAWCGDGFLATAFPWWRIWVMDSFLICRLHICSPNW